MQTRVKICGLTRPDDVAAAVAAGAAWLGFVFFRKSPRNLSLDAARALALSMPPGPGAGPSAGPGKVALSVDAGDDFLDALLAEVPIDMLQLHGSEPPERVAALRKRHGLPVMKAIGISCPEDLPAIDTYARVADQLLIDAKPAPGAVLPGGNGLAFDWRLIAHRRWPVPWMLAGGLNPDNVAEAIRLTGARQVDVSSGVEAAPGQKDAGLIRAFVRAARTADADRPPRLKQ